MTHPFPYSIKRHGTTLETCESEPVQTPGCIQSHGALLALRPGDLTILQVSENSAQWLGTPPENLLNLPLEKVLPAACTARVRDALARDAVERSSFYLFTLAAGEAGNPEALQASLHANDGVAILELEREAGAVETDYYALMRRSLARFQSATNVGELAQFVTEEIRRESELDRVMVYFFHADESGEVIAESKREGLNSWLGWRYPAHDIPKPAREIFKKIWSRPVPDIQGELAEIVPLLNPDTKRPLDMTYCVLRGPSRMYTEYLANMGVGAALTLPLLSGSELWGLIACHHNSAKPISYRVRAAGEFLARAASQQMQMLEEREAAAYRSRLEAVNYALIAKMSVEPHFSAFARGEPNLLSGLDAGGAAIFYQGQWHTVGECPAPNQLETLGKWLLARPELKPSSSQPILVTDSLSSLFPPAVDYVGPASGLIAVRFQAESTALLAWFRQETLQTITWAGNPNELSLAAGPIGSRLTPRKSFEIWRETVSNRALPWKKVEIEGALRLRELIVDLVVSRGAQLESLRRALDLSRARFDISLDAAQLGAWELDTSTQNAWRTPRHDKIFGYDEMLPEWVFSRFIEHVPETDRASVVNRLETAFAEKSVFELEIPIVDAKGARKWIWVYGTPIEAEGRTTFVGLVGDITEKVKDREMLAARGKELQALVDERTSELTATVGELEAFSYSISHDMRSPLRAMQGFSQALLEDFGDKLPEEGLDYLKRIERGSKRLDLLIQDVLTYSRMAKSEAVLHAVELKPLIEETIQSHDELQEPRATVNLEIEAGQVLAHEAFLSQVFSNLLGNAVKFQPRDSKPVVTVRSEPHEGNRVRIWVCDNGIGIEPDHFKRIFRIFGRVHADKAYQGTGIGLAIVKKAVDRMGGEIGLDSEPGRGTRFWFTLKAAP